MKTDETTTWLRDSYACMCEPTGEALCRTEKDFGSSAGPGCREAACGLPRKLEEQGTTFRVGRAQSHGCNSLLWILTWEILTGECKSQWQSQPRPTQSMIRAIPSRVFIIVLDLYEYCGGGSDREAMGYYQKANSLVSPHGNL